MVNGELKRIDNDEMFIEWDNDLDDIREYLDEAIRKKLIEGIKVVLDSPDDELLKPFVTISDRAHRPLDMFLYIPQLGDDISWSFNIEEALKDSIDQCEEDGSFIKKLEQISKALKDLAAKIDVSVNKGKAAQRK